MKYSKQIKSFCETHKCQYFSYKQQYINNWNTGKMQTDGKLYFCSHPSYSKTICMVKPECPKD